MACSQGRCAAAQAPGREVKKQAAAAAAELKSNLRDHHRKKTFQEEYIELLKENEIEFDERYLW